MLKLTRFHADLLEIYLSAGKPINTGKLAFEIDQKYKKHVKVGHAQGDLFLEQLIVPVSKDGSAADMKSEFSTISEKGVKVLADFNKLAPEDQIKRSIVRDVQGGIAGEPLLPPSLLALWAKMRGNKAVGGGGTEVKIKADTPEAAPASSKAGAAPRRKK